MTAPAPDASAAAAAAQADAALMNRVRAGDETAFAELMQRWELPVKSVIARLVLNAAEAEDLAQETFVRLWQHRDRFTPGKPLKPWLLGIAINLARNRLRWWKRRPVVALDEWTETAPDATARPLEHRERAAAVRDAIAALSPEFREAIVLFEYEQMSYADIAATVGVSPKTIENRLARAREKLRTTLRPLAP